MTKTRFFNFLFHIIYALGLTPQKEHDDSINGAGMYGKKVQRHLGQRVMVHPKAYDS